MRDVAFNLKQIGKYLFMRFLEKAGFNCLRNKDV